MFENIEIKVLFVCVFQLVPAESSLSDTQSQCEGSGPGDIPKLPATERLGGIGDSRPPSFQYVFLTYSPYLENLEYLEFCHLLFQVWKMHWNCSKSGKTLNFNKKLEFVNSVFSGSLFKMSFAKFF